MSLKKCLLLAAGFASLAIGIVGIILPLLPTTPFLLLSAGCFLRSSERFYTWITGHRLFGAYIKNYLKYRAVSVRSKVFSLIMLWAVILISEFHFTALWLRLLLAAVAVGVSIHILTMRTLTNEMINEDEEIK